MAMFVVALMGNIYSGFIEPDLANKTLLKMSIKYSLLEDFVQIVKVWHLKNGFLVEGIKYD